MNLTQQLSLVSRVRPGYDPLPGHDLAVFEVIGDGLQFHSTAPEGRTFEPPRRGLLRKVSQYVSHAVNNNQDRKDSSSQRFKHKTEGHSFDLKFSIRYSALDAGLLARKVVANEDPLREVRDKVEQLLSSEVAKTPWEEIEREKRADNFAELGAEIYQKHREVLTDFAARQGILLQDVGIDFNFTAEDAEIFARQTGKHRTLSLGKTQAEIDEYQLLQKTAWEKAEITAKTEVAEKQHELNRQQQRNSNELTILRVQGEVIQAGAEALGTAVKNIGRDTHSPESLRQGVEVIQQLVLSSAAPSAAGQVHSHSLSGPEMALLPGASGMRSELSKLTLEVFDQFANSSEAFSKRVMVHALHWIAELSLGDAADRQLLDKCKAELTNPRGDLKSSQMLLLRRLLNENEMRDLLS